MTSDQEQQIRIQNRLIDALIKDDFTIIRSDIVGEFGARWSNDTPLWVISIDYGRAVLERIRT